MFKLFSCAWPPIAYAISVYFYFLPMHVNETCKIFTRKIEIAKFLLVFLLAHSWKTCTEVAKFSARLARSHSHCTILLSQFYLQIAILHARFVYMGSECLYAVSLILP